MRIARIFLLSISISLVFVGLLDARIILVPEERESISAGVSAAQSGDTVLVADGEYTGGSNTSIRISRSITVMSENGPAACVINAEDRDGVYAFELATGTVIDGFTITGTMDHAIKATSIQNFIVRNCVLTRNRNLGDQNGTSIRVQSSTGLIEKTIFTGNQSGIAGGGIVLTTNANLTVWNCIFRENSTVRFGGGILITQNSEATIGNCIFIQNEAQVDGGAIALSVGSDAVIYNCTILDNVAIGWGGGLYKGSDSNPEIFDCIFWGNEANIGPQLAAQGNGEIFISFCTVEGGQDLEAGWGGDPIYEDSPRFDNGRDPEWGFNGFYLHENSPCIDAGSGPVEDVGMDTLTTQIDRSLDEEEVDLGFHYDPDDFTPIGELYGSVFDAADSSDVRDAYIVTSFGQEGFSSRIGFWSITEAIAGEFDITASADGYNDTTLTGFELEEGEELEINFYLLHPEINVSLDRIDARIVMGDTSTVDLNLQNSGNGPLEWSVERRLVGEANVDPWELRRSHFVGQALEATRIHGVAFIDGFYYVTDGSGDINLVHVFDIEGQLIRTFPQFDESRYGMKDLAYDGELIWGSGARMVYGFNTEGELVRSFEGPVNPNTNIAWDPDREVLWLCGITTPIAGYDTSGNDVIEDRIDAMRIFGLAYWADDPDGYPLYLINHDDEIDTYFVLKMNPESHDTMLVAELDLIDGERPLGCYITDELDPYSLIFLTIGNVSPAGGGDRINLWQLASNISWMQVDISDGIIQPEEQQDLVLTLYTEGFDEGAYDGQLVFNHNAIFGSTDIPITMNVLHPDAVPGTDLLSPTKFSIESIHPNPFNAGITVSYTISHPGYVNLAVYDLTGREIAYLQDDYHETGRFHVNIDASDWSSGVYLARLESEGGIIRMAKLVCVK